VLQNIHDIAIDESGVPRPLAAQTADSLRQVRAMSISVLFVSSLSFFRVLLRVLLAFLEFIQFSPFSSLFNCRPSRVASIVAFAGAALLCLADVPWPSFDL
jgi:hypothetical protein